MHSVVQRPSSILSVIVLAVVPLLLSAGPTTLERRVPGESSHLYIVFLPGLCGWPHADPYCFGRVNAKARAQATFAPLRRALAAASVHYTPLYYSYDPVRSTYTVAETHQAVARSVSALDHELSVVWHRDPSAHFDLVGHSLGGVIAASWAVSHRAPPPVGLLPTVHSIVTYDSPLKGIQSRYVSWRIVQLLGQFFGGPVWSNLQPASRTIRQIVSFRDPWWRSAGHLHSIANRDDTIVPAPEALLGERKLVTDGNCPRDLLVIRSCHGAVLSDAPLNHYVACHWIAAPHQCVVAPTPTPTPVRVTATSTLSPSTPISTPSTPISTPLPPTPPPATLPPAPRVQTATSIPITLVPTVTKTPGMPR